MCTFKEKTCLNDGNVENYVWKCNVDPRCTEDPSVSDRSGEEHTRGYSAAFGEDNSSTVFLGLDNLWAL